MTENDIVILGAGLSGLSTAYHLGEGYDLFEKEETAGGMARSIYKDGYIFDYDGHLLHFRNDYTFSLVRELLSGNLAPHKRNSWIYSKRAYTKYPFQSNFYGLPIDVVIDCLVGIIKAKAGKYNVTYGPRYHHCEEPAIRRQQQSNLKDNIDFETWIRNTFGNGIAEHFMLPYNKKFWTIKASELTCDWLYDFIPVPSLEDTVTGAISNNAKPYGYNSKFWYPVKGGISELSVGFLKRINNFFHRKKAVMIDQYKKEIVFEGAGIKKFRKLVSTVPLPELSNLLVNLPMEIKSAFSMLKWTSVFVVNFGLKKDDVTDKHWIYYPESDTVFYRIGFPTNFSMDVAPPERTSIYAEISYHGSKDIDKNKAVDDTIVGLQKLGFISGEGDIEICLPMDIKYGYVIYDKERNKAVKIIKDYLERFDIYTIGRYGGWKYMSMEDAILEGRQIAELVAGASRQMQSCCLLSAPKDSPTCPSTF